MPRFEPRFLDELKARLRPSDVIGRYVQLRRQGNEWAALSPFTKEKTPSFFVNDQKGFYHCFSSGKHGDIISFLMETQGLTFNEAVTELAREAGIDLPKEDPRAEARRERSLGLTDACNAATAFFIRQLQGPAGQGAADYLERRHVSADQIEAFRIGYAPAGRTALKDALLKEGFTEETLVEAGLLIRLDDGAVYDRFRDRVMFPILGRKGEAIAFGGRALDPGAKAKYLNSPETPIFHKGATLYNYEAARTQAHQTSAPMIVCEGYLDVIALWGAGFRTAVAPMGTALTEDQLALLWRVSDEPVLCFDGDKAGLRAAYRSVERALPNLKPGKSLRFAFLPSGQDPDDLIRAGGAPAFRAELETLTSLIDVLWRRETEDRDLSTPERRAALKAGMRTLVDTIADRDVRSAYAVDIVGRLRAVFAPAGEARGRDGGPSSGRAGGPGSGRGAFRRYRSDHARLMAEARPSNGARAGAATPWLREATLLLAAIRHPRLAADREADILALSLADPGLDGLLSDLLGAILAFPTLDREGLNDHLRSTGSADILERILSNETLNRQSFLRPDAETAEVERGFEDTLRLQRVMTGMDQDLAESAAHAFRDGDDIWKATLAARDELIHARRDDGEAAADGISRDDLHGKLERMRETLAAKKRS